MRSFISVSPFRCRMWALHDRLDAYLTEESCRAEINSFSKHGQLVPALGRPVRGDPDYDVELIYGARRLFVARHLNKDLLVELRDLPNRDAIIAMDMENRQRVDVSPYERARSYARWLGSGHFKSQDDLARALKVSSSQVSRLLKLARIPSAVVNAFNSPMDICEGWGLDLMDILSDSAKREPTLAKAREISTTLPRPPSREVYQHLLAASVRGRKVRAKPHDEVVKDINGNPLFRIRRQRNSIAILLPMNKLSARGLEAIRSAVVGVLQTANTQTVEHSRQKSLPYPTTNAGVDAVREHVA